MIGEPNLHERGTRTAAFKEAQIRWEKGASALNLGGGSAELPKVHAGIGQAYQRVSNQSGHLVAYSIHYRKADFDDE